MKDFLFPYLSYAHSLCFVFVSKDFLFACACIGPPRITSLPKDARVMHDGAAIFICRAEGQPEPRITWRKDGVELTEANSHDRAPHSISSLLTQSGLRGSILSLRFLRHGRDEGEYECVAENGVGDPVSGKAYLEILRGEQLFTRRETGVLGELRAEASYRGRNF